MNKLFRTILFLIVILITLGGFSVVQNSKAAINKQFNYQGKLTDSSRVAVSDGVYNIVFKLYTQAGGGTAAWTESWNTTLWTQTDTWTSITADTPAVGLSRIIYTTGTNETTLKAGQTLWNITQGESAPIYAVDTGNNYIDIQTPYSTWVTTDDLTNKIYIKNGLFSVLLGSVTSLPEFTSADYYLSVNVEANGEMVPRKKIGAVPYAWNANNVVGDGYVDIDNTSVSRDAVNINYNPASGTYDAVDITYGSGGGTGNALTVTQSGTGDIVNLTGDSITTGTGLALSVDGLSSGMGLDITSTSTAGLGSNSTKLLNLARSGTNTIASHTAYGLYSAVTNTGTTSTNIGGYFSASGATNNYGIYSSVTAAGSTTAYALYADAGAGAGTEYAGIFINGNVGIGDTTPAATLTVGDGDLFQVAGSTGNITVAAGQGLDATASGILNIGNTTATTVNVGNTAATTLAIGAGGALTRAINVGTGSGADTISIGTGGGADVIAIGTASADLSLTDAHWSVTGPGAATFTSLDAGSGAISGGAGSFTTLTSSGNTTLATGVSTTNTFGSGASSINTIGSVTTPGTLTLHGATTLDNTFTVSGSNLTSLGGDLTVTGTAWTATPTISGVVTMTSGFDSNAASTVEGLTVDGNGNLTVSNGTLSVTAPSTTGNSGEIITNSLTTGTGLDISSSSTALTTGRMLSLDWSPGSATTATGDLFRINIGSNGTVGNLLNVTDNGTSLFSVSETVITSALPHSFTAVGDVSMAYDLLFTNQTASYIKSNAPLYLEAGESFESNDLTFKTYNQGSVVIDTAVTTGNAFDIFGSTLTSGNGIRFTGSTSTGVTGNVMSLTSDIGSAGKMISLAPDFSGSAVTGYGIYQSATDATANANTDYGYYSDLTLTGNAAKTGTGIYSTVSSASTTADTLVALDLAIDATGAITTGTRTIYGSRSQPASTAASSGTQALNLYGSYLAPSSTLAVAGTTNVYGEYITTTASHNADAGTVNQYGLYVANGTSSTNGTSTKYGLYVEEPTGADSNYAAVFAGGNVGIGTAAPLSALDVRGTIENGLVAWWSMDEGTGTTIADQSINSNAGTLTAGSTSGTVDSGSATTLVDDALTQADDYWNGWIVEIVTTTDGLAPQGETATITDFIAASDTLQFAALTAAVEANDTYKLYYGDENGPTWTNGKFDKALSFDGSNDYVNVTTNFSGLTDMTYVAWIYPISGGQNNLGRIIHKKNSVSGSPSVLIDDREGSNGDNVLRFEYDWTGVNGNWNSPDGSITFNEWNHIAVTYSNTSLANDPVMYINGVSVTPTEVQTPSGSQETDDNSLFIGNRNDFIRTFDGTIDSVRIYNRVLSAREISESYRQKAPSMSQGGTVSDNSAYDALTVQQSGTGDAILINQDGNGIALNIDSEATTTDVINMDLENTQGTLFDINMDTVTLVGALTGFDLDFTTGVTSGTQTVRGFDISLPTDDAAGTRTALYIDGGHATATNYGVDFASTALDADIYKSAAAALTVKANNQNIVFDAGTASVNVAPSSTLAADTNALDITGTLNATPTGAIEGVDVNITSAGSAAQTQAALDVNLAAGYTGASNTYGINLGNAAVGTGTNYGIYSALSQSTAGTNAAGYFSATNAGAGEGYAIITGSGNVGIGTATPTGILTVRSDSTTNVVSLLRTENLGVAAIGTGGSVDFYANRTTGGTTQYTSLESVVTSIDNTNYSGKLNMKVASNGSLVTMIEVGNPNVVINRPLEVNVAGNTGISYDLNFLNTGTTQITSEGPLVISAGDSNHNENLTITTGSNTVGGDSGVATAGAATTLTDSAKAWTADEWIGGTITIIGGTGAGQVQAITDNTTTAITVADWTGSDPAAKSIYHLAYARGGDVIANVQNSDIVYGGFKVAGIDDGGYVFRISPDGDVEIGGNGFGGSDLTIKQNTTLTGGILTVGQLSAPGTPTCTKGGSHTAGATTYEFKITALNDNGETTASAQCQVTSALATLTATDYVQITWDAVSGATKYQVYGCSGASCTEKLEDDPLIVAPTTSYIANDSTFSATDYPSSNTTGGRIAINTTVDGTDDRRLETLDTGNPQLRLTQTNDSVYADFEVSSLGDLTISLYPNTTGNDIILNQPGGSTGANLWICEGTACPSITLSSGGNLVAENDVYIEGSLALGDATAKTGSFTGFTAAETKTLNITSLKTDNPVVRKIKLYISNDPTADTNINFRLSFYDADSMTEDELIKDFYFNLTYTEVKTAEWAASGTGGDCDATAGLLKYDLVRLMGGTAEEVRTTAVTDADTLAVTTLGYAHAVDTGIVKVVELTDLFQLYDADSSKEIHAKLETFAAPTASMNVAISIDLQ